MKTGSRNAIFFSVNPHKILIKFSLKITKKLLTYRLQIGILMERLRESGAYYAMKREIARCTEVTSVEYVRCRVCIRHAIGRLKLDPVCAYIAGTSATG